MMKNIVDVMAIQQRTDNVSNSPKAIQTDYRKKEGAGVVPRFLFECSIKLSMKPLTSATAAIIFHRFFNEVQRSDYDQYLIASSCLYLAGKIKDDPVKIRDVINVSYSTLNRGTAPLDLGDEYWSMRDAIVQAELLIARTLKFDLNIEHPHKFLLYFMKSLKEWLGPNTWNSLPIAKTAAAFLQDFHHNPKILNHNPSHIAVCCLSLALQTYGVQVPLTNETDENSAWYSVFVTNLSKEKHWEILEEIMEVYNHESDIDNN